MKKLLLSAALVATATSVSAMDLGYGLSLSAETTVDVLDINNGDIFTGVDWKAEYVWNGMTAYTEVSSDADFDFGDITVGAKIKF